MSKKHTTEVKLHHYKHRRKPNRSIGGDVGIYIFLGIASLIMFFPIIFTIASSLKPLDEALKNPPDVYRFVCIYESELHSFLTLSV